MPRTNAPVPAAPLELRPDAKTGGAPPAPTGAEAAETPPPAAADGPAPDPAPSRSSKLDRLVALLRRPEGATLAEMTAATGWQAHSVRGALAGSLRKKGHAVTSEKADGTRRYRIAEGGQ